MEIKITTQMNMQVRKTEIKVNRKRRQRREIIAVVDKKRSFAVRKNMVLYFDTVYACGRKALVLSD